MQAVHYLLFWKYPMGQTAKHVVLMASRYSPAGQEVQDEKL